MFVLQTRKNLRVHMKQKQQKMKQKMKKVNAMKMLPHWSGGPLRMVSY